MISDLEKGSWQKIIIIFKNGFGSQQRVTDLAASTDDIKKDAGRGFKSVTGGQRPLCTRTVWTRMNQTAGS